MTLSKNVKGGTLQLKNGEFQYELKQRTLREQIIATRTGVKVLEYLSSEYLKELHIKQAELERRA